MKSETTKSKTNSPDSTILSEFTQTYFSEKQLIFLTLLLSIFIILLCSYTLHETLSIQSLSEYFKNNLTFLKIRKHG